ncbi:helix-turn-helix transcriptional regulator [Arthrobacter sp. 1P04PC]|uniref:helix-turn-helix domain-containing protein n=1 Tax=unclassified Arthrobacter TaxID=235627 RepID=UPI0039A3245B
MPTDHDRSIGTKSARRRAKYLSRQNRELVAQLVQIRKEAGLRQDEVAKLLGHSQQAVSEFERMVTPASLSRISNYAQAVGALVTHHVAKDTGQLEVHGDRWIQFVELPVALHEAASAETPLPLEYKRNFSEDVPSTYTIGFSGIAVSTAAISRRTDFALSA